MMGATTGVAVLLTVATLTEGGVQQPASGSGQVAGVVVTADATPAPVRRAIVTLKGDGPASWSEITDEQGRFVFNSVPPGRFVLSASRPGFITAVHGARRPGRPGTPLSVSPSQAITGIKLQMARGASISGTVRDRSGQLVPAVQIVVVRAGTMVTPSTTRTEAPPILTDDRGIYRAFGLEAGKYVVAAVPPGLFILNEIRVSTSAEIDDTLRQLQQRAARRASPSGAPLADQRAPASTASTTGSDQKHTFTPVFYPGTPSQAEAMPLTLGAGEERVGVDIPLMLVPTATVEGTVVAADGTPVSGVMLFISGAGSPVPPSFSGAPVLNARPGPDGRFRYSNVAPGRYTLTARITGANPMWASADIDVAGRDITGLTLTLRPAMSFSGRIAFDSQAGAAPELKQIRVTLTPPPGSEGFGLNSTMFGGRFPAAGQVGEDARFRVTGVLPGEYRVSATAPSGGTWWLRSIVANGRDLLDEPLDIGASDVTDAVVTFSDRHSALEGVLQTSAGQPAVEYTIVVFSTEGRFWLPGSRRTKSARPASDGRFIFADLPPGEYALAALEDLDPAELADPAFLEQVLPGAVKVTVADGEKVSQNLRIVR